MTDVFTQLQRRTQAVLAAVVIVTAALVVPFLTMAPDESASTEPGGAVFDARDLVDERFVSSVHAVGFVAEHASGDLLRPEPLGDLLDAQAAIRVDPEIGPTLFSYYDTEAALTVDGPFSIADLVDAELRSAGIDGVRNASGTDIDDAVDALVERHGETNTLLGLSQLTERQDGRWVAPAVLMSVVSDDTVLGFGNTSVNLGGDTDVEEYDRELQEILRTAPGWKVNGIAIDVNLTSQEQGAVAGPFIGFTVLAALLLVGLTFRSYWIMATVSVMFMVLIIWLKGISNLIGFKDDLVLSLIVPVAMVSFGVDYAFHSIGRYREERAEGRKARAAAVAGGAAVSGALILATMSDSVAFLANTTAGIESIVQFGIGAAIALASAYVLLGVVAPLLVAEIEARVPAPRPGRRSGLLRVLASVGAAQLTMASMLLLVFILPWLGVVVAAVSVVAVLVVPVIYWSRRLDGEAVGDLESATSTSSIATRIGRVVAAIARRRRIVIPAALMATVVAGFFAVQVPARFDVEDFFAADTDFVEGLNQLDRHVGNRSGEPISFYVEGDLSDPQNLAQLQERIGEIRSLQEPALAREGGGVRIETGVFELFDQTFASPIMTTLVADRTQVAITDVNGDGIPDTREQVQALVRTASEIGVPLDAERLAMTPDDVAIIVDLAQAENANDATVFALEVVNSRDQGSVQAARAALAPFTEAVSDDLGGTFVQTTGSAFVREASLEGTNRALVVSLPVALLACLIVATVFLRSLRYGIVSIVPIVMVVAWLYAFMEIAGFAINLVTATIAAVSIGIGIDFALHYVSRYREELLRWGDRVVAVRVAGEGTGLALVASAISSAVGFGILAFAPMPLFAAYGLLTALMIMMALVATLAVLPSLLMIVTQDAVVDGGPSLDLRSNDRSGGRDIAQLVAD